MRMKFRSLTLCALLGAFTSGAGAQAPSPTVDGNRLAAFVDGAVGEAMLRDHFAGASVAIVDRSGVLLARGYGEASLDPVRPASERTLFRVGSISKTLVWIAIMQLVEQQTLSLNDPVNDHLPPDLQIPDEGFSEPIRVHHLLTHSAGFEDSALGHLFVTEASELLPLETYLQRYRVHRVRAPGELSVYSNYGATLAGAIVAHASGLSWPDYTEQRILRPLGMATATYREPYSSSIANANKLPAPMPAEVAQNTSQGFRWQDAKLEARPFEHVQVAPAGSLSANALDMAAFMGALLDPQRMEAAKVLRSDTALAMREALASNYEGIGPWRHGFMDVVAARPQSGFGHDGDTIYQHSTMAILPDLGVGIFISVNTPTGASLRSTLTRVVLEEFYGVAPPAAVRGTDASARSEQFAGDYLSLRRPYHRTERAIFRLLPVNFAVAENGDLIAALGYEQQRYAPLGNGVFQQVDGSARIAFREVDGVMRAYDPYGAGPMDRVGFFDSAGWLLLIGALAHIAAIAAIWTALRRGFAGKSQPRSWAFAALGLLWLVASGVTAAAILPWAGSDLGEIMFSYPGPLFPIAGWLLLVAAIASPMVILAVAFFLRPTTWFERAKTIAASAAFLMFAATLASWGFLGFASF